MNRRKKAIFWKINLRVKPGDIVIYENSYYLNKNGINSNPLNDSNWLYLGDVSKKVLDFTFSDDGTLGNGFNKLLDNVRNLSFSGDDFEYEIDETEGVLLIKLKQNEQQTIDYSINEIKTGATWINGKPIYRKVIPFNTPELSYVGNLTIAHNCNVSTYIKADIINTGLNTGVLVTFPLASLNNSFTPDLPFFLSSGIINMTSNEIVFDEIQAKDGERTTDSFLILEYTKNI